MVFFSYVASGFSSLYCGPMGAATAGSSAAWDMMRSSATFCSLSLYFFCLPYVGFEICRKQGLRCSVRSGEKSTLINPLVDVVWKPYRVKAVLHIMQRRI